MFTSDASHIVAGQTGEPKTAEEVSEDFLHVHLVEPRRCEKLVEFADSGFPEAHLAQHVVQRFRVVDLSIVR